MFLRPKFFFAENLPIWEENWGLGDFKEAKWPKRAKIVYFAYLGLPEVLIYGVYTLLVGL